MMTINHLAQSAGVLLVSGIWQGVVLAAAVWICLRLLPVSSATLRFTVWTIVLAVVAFLPFVEGVVPQHAASSVQGAAPLFHLDPRWSLMLVGVWAALSLFRAGGLILHATRLRRMQKRSTPVTDSRFATVLFSHRRKVELCTSTEVDRPSVIGFLAPAILVPAWLLDQLTAAELEQIVLHEMEHLRRGDDWLNLIQKLSLVLFPLNPVLVWVERRLCFERELACDDGVLRRTRAPRAYATCLTQLAERGLDQRSLSLALGTLGAFGAQARQSELARRVHRILRREASLSPMAARSITALVGAGLAVGAVGLAHCPQLVSFSATAHVHLSAQTQAQSSDTRLAPLPLHGGETAVRAERVTFTEARQPHSALIKASLRERFSPAPTVEKSTARKYRHPEPEAQRISRSYAAVPSLDRDSGRGWVVLSSWPVADQTQVDRFQTDQNGPNRSRTVLPATDPRVVQTIFAPRYAAVPTEDGWLIIQL